jgi:hypothetical protein
MSYVPVYCDDCGRGSLVRAKNAQQPLLCAFCEGPTRPIPGPAFADADWLAFADVDNAVFEADLDAFKAASLAAKLQSLIDRGESPSAMVAFVTENEPALMKARPALLNQPQRGLRMLMTALTARSRETPAELRRRARDFREP